MILLVSHLYHLRNNKTLTHACVVGGLQDSDGLLPLRGHGELLLAAGGGPVSSRTVGRVLLL